MSTPDAATHEEKRPRAWLACALATTAFQLSVTVWVR